MKTVVLLGVRGGVARNVDMYEVSRCANSLELSGDGLEETEDLSKYSPGRHSEVPYNSSAEHVRRSSLTDERSPRRIIGRASIQLVVL